MKISLHIEADTPEEFDKAINSIVKFDVLAAALQDRSESEPAPPWTDRAIERARVSRETSVSPVPQQATPEPESPQIEPSEVEKPAKRTRGPNKPKMAPITEEPEEEPVEVAPPVLKTPVGPAPKIEVPVSRQDLLDVFSEYVQRYGINFGYTDISNLLQKHLGDGVRKASDVPEELLSKAVVAIRAAINDNPFNRKRDYA